MLKYTILLTTLLILASVSIANDPAYGIPWPVGSTDSLMNFTKTLMNGYGDRNNGWYQFHTGIDIDNCTEPEDGNCVRCVEDGVIGRIRHIGTSSGYFVVVIPTPSSQYGWCYGHLKDPAAQGWFEGRSISEGALIDTMINTPAMDPHVHFSWVDKDSVNTCLVNPLDYLTPEPEGSNYWQFNPDELTPAFEHMFLREHYANEWSSFYPNSGLAQDSIMDDDNLTGNVDFFFGVALQGGDAGGTDDKCFVDCTPERVYWELIRENESGSEVLSENYVVNFDCPLTNDDETAKMFTFVYSMNAMFGNEGVLMCLTNCGDTQGWENLGIDNIEENSWRTNKNYAYLNVTTINPVLAEYPDGSYSIDVTCYAHVNDVDPTPNPEVTFDASIPCELHNFSPALYKVCIKDAESDQIYYHAEWIPNDLSAELDTTVNEPVDAGAELQVILWFTESMTTGSLSASLGPLSIGNGEWSSSVVPNDTWAGEVTMPTDTGKGEYVLSVSATDLDYCSLMNPEGIGSVPESPTPDTHHSLNLSFGIDFEWSVTLPEPIRGSVAIADIDGDGYMELAVKTEEGTVHIYNHDGTIAAGWPRSNTGYAETYYDVHITPALGDISGDGYMDVASGYHCGSMAWDAAGNTLSGWPFKVNGVELEGQDFAFSSPVICNLDADAALEVVACRQLYAVPTGGPTETVFAIDSNGSEIWSTDLNPADGGESVMGTPVVVDVTGDAIPEVLVCTSSVTLIGGDEKQSETDGIYCNGRLYLLSGSTGNILYSSSIIGEWIYGSPVVGDIDGDLSPEVVIPCFMNDGGQVKAYVFSLPSLTLEHSWLLVTSSPSFGAMSSAALGDINNDGSIDVVIVGFNKVFAWDGVSKLPVPGFETPVGIGASIRHGASLADIDNDGYLEILLCTQGGKLIALNHDGTVCGGFPIQFGSSSNSQPAIGDIDNDGRLEICVADRNVGKILVYQAQESSWPASLPWSQYQHDARNSGVLGSDFTIPEPPTDFAGEGELAGSFFTVDLTWTLSVNDPFSPDAVPPADVVSYQIFRRLWPGPFELITRVVAGTDSYTDVVSMSGFFPVIAYRMSASDGVNESICTSPVKLNPYALDNIAAGCPVREIMHSSAVQTSSSHSAIAGGVSVSTASLVEPQRGNNCRVLTDGDYDGIYIPSGSSDCVEIDLGDVFQVNDLLVIGADLSLTDSPRYELSADGRNFSDINSGTARYVRVYGAAGATEIEVLGSLSEAASAPVEILRGASGTYRIISVESGTPLTVSVFDLSGRSVWNSASSTGEVLWNRCNSSGNTVPSGVYLIMVESDDMDTFTSKVIVR